MTDKNKNSGKINIAGAATAGAAAGAVGSTAANAMPKIKVEIVTEADTEPTADTTPETPEPEQAILANEEGIRFAHVEADSFGEAFAQARAQVGPGGAFEYNGKIYSTYIAEEWDAMSADERASYQQRVFQEAPTHHTQTSSSTSTTVTHNDRIPDNTETVSDDTTDSGIKVLEVETVNEDGRIMNLATVDFGGEQALLVDLDNDGVIDVMLCDENNDGEIDSSEITDVSEAGIEIIDLMQSQAASEGNYLYASNDDMPDYVNDADSVMSV